MARYFQYDAERRKWVTVPFQDVVAKYRGNVRPSVRFLELEARVRQNVVGRPVGSRLKIWGLPSGHACVSIGLIVLPLSIGFRFFLSKLEPGAYCQSEESYDAW